jgi:hypothetical protein
MARTGIRRIDALLESSPAVPALVPGDGDPEAVGFVQELLRSHGFTRLPDMRTRSYGAFGELTRDAVLRYRAARGLPAIPNVDGALIADLAGREPPEPLACRGYLTLGLDFEYGPLLGLMALTCLFESGGRFACLNLNTDRQGLSFGIIQWAQRPGRLHEILKAFQDEELAVFEELGGSPGLVAWTARPNGGVDPATGVALQSAWSLVDEPWKGRFAGMGRRSELQKVQVQTAQSDFRASLEVLRAPMPLISSQRGFAFALDVANQHGDGGARKIYQSVVRPGMNEAEALAAMERESVRRVAVQYGPGSPEAASTANRRAFFRTTPYLSDALAAFA